MLSEMPALLWTVLQRVVPRRTAAAAILPPARRKPRGQELDQGKCRGREPGPGSAKPEACTSLASDQRDRCPEAGGEGRGVHGLTGEEQVTLPHPEDLRRMPGPHLRVLGV